MSRLEMYLPDELDKKLREHSDTTGLTIAEIVRRAVCKDLAIPIPKIIRGGNHHKYKKEESNVQSNKDVSKP